MSNCNFAELKEKVSDWTADDEDIVRLILNNIVAEKIKRIYRLLHKEV
jgi:hypothetical protein